MFVFVSALMGKRHNPRVRRWSSIGLPVVLLGGLACTPERFTASDPSSVAASSATAVDAKDALPKEIRDEEAVFAALAFQVPSSAGYYLDENGNTVIRRAQTIPLGNSRGRATCCSIMHSPKSAT